MSTGTPPTPTPPATPAQRPTRLRKRGFLRRLGVALLVLFILLLAVLGLAWTLLHNEGATARIVPMLPGVKVTGASGPLLGDFKAQRIDIALPRGGYIVVYDAAWKGLTLRPDAGVAWQVAVRAGAVSARRVDFHWVPGPPSPKKTPLSDLDLPLSVRIGRVQVGEVHSRYWGPAPLVQVDAQLALQVPRGLIGREHRAKVAGVVWQGWRARGEATAGTSGKMPIDATLAFEGSPDDEGLRRVQVSAHAKGPLARLNVRSQLRLAQQKEDGAAVPRGMLDVDGDVAPLAAWPLPRLKARATEVNLAGLHPALPATLLSGDVLIEPAASRDLEARLDLRNALPGRLDAARLPVHALRGRVGLIGARGAATPAEALREGVADVVAQVPAVGQKEPGSVALKGGWGGTRTVKAEWRGLTPQALHGAGPPLLLQGSLVLKPQWRDGLTQLAATPMEVTAQAQGQYGQAFLAVPAASSAAGKGAPAGLSAPAVPMPVGMTLSARYEPGRLAVRLWKLQAQDAHAELKDSLLQWGGTVPWALKAHVDIQNFDPRVWMPWPATMTGANRLSAKAEAQLDANWRGQLKADVAPSVLAGVPLKGHARWQSPLDRQQMTLALDLDAGGNTVTASAELPWRLDAQGGMRWSDSAQWQGRVQAPALHALQAIAPLLGAARITGAIAGEGSAKGLWPNLATQGRLSVDKFQWDTRGGQTFALASAKGDWQIDTHSMEAPMRARLELSKGQAATLALEQAALSMDGSLRDHQARLQADFMQQMPNPRKPVAIHAELAAQGGVARDPKTAAFTAWQGQVSQILLRTGGLTPHVLLHAQPFKVQAGWAGDARHVTVSPTLLNTFGVALALRRLEWRTASLIDDPTGELHAEVQLTPLNLSTVLASWQPQAGWGGDLQLTGRFAVDHTHAHPWQVDAEIQRQSGDLTLAEPTIEGNVVQRLGIRLVGLTLKAREGVWVLDEQFDGRLFGLLSGRQTVTVADRHSLPSPTDALGGQVDVQVRNLRPWGSWLPAGWRLSGQLQASAKLGGTLGAPQYAGTVDGEGLGLAQALLGVNITDGILQMKLEGDQLNLTRLEAKSGSQGGLLSATGNAVLGESPELRVQLKAERFALLQRVDRRVVISGDANGVAGAEEIKVQGYVKVEEGLIDISKSDAPVVGEDVYVVNKPGDEEEEEEEEAAGASQRKLNASIDVDLGRNLKLRGRGLDAFLTGGLHLSTPGNKPSIRGTIRVENGTYAAYGQKLVVERGAVTFTGAIENPRLDILAMRAQSPTAASTDVKVGVNITGTAQDPRVRLYSDPAMSETEKLSWLVLGRAPTGLGGADIGLLQTAAVALLSGEKSSPSDNLVGKLGLDELSIKQTDGAVRETVVNLGKQVSKYWYVGYERNLNATSGNWQLIYRLAQRVTVRAQAGDDNAVDFIWFWRWD